MRLQEDGVDQRRGQHGKESQHHHPPMLNLALHLPVNAACVLGQRAMIVETMGDADARYEVAHALISIVADVDGDADGVIALVLTQQECNQVAVDRASGFFSGLHDLSRLAFAERLVLHIGSVSAPVMAVQASIVGPSERALVPGAPAMLRIESR